MSVKWSEIPDSTVLEYEQENQKRPGSKSHDLYERYKRSKTFGEAKANGARPEDFRHDFGKGWLKLFPEGELPIVEKKEPSSAGPKRAPKDGARKSKEEELIWEDTRDPEEVQQDLLKQAELSKELQELKNDQYKKRERPKDAFERAMEAFSKGDTSSSKKVKTQAAALDLNLEKAHKEKQKEAVEKAKKDREEKAEKAKLEEKRPKSLMSVEVAKVKQEKRTQVKVERFSEKEAKDQIEKAIKLEKEKAEKAEKAEKKEKVEVKLEKDKVKLEKTEKEKKLKKDKKEKKHKKDKKHKKHRSHEHQQGEKAEGEKKKAGRTAISAARIRELLRHRVIGRQGLLPSGEGKPPERDAKGMYLRNDLDKQKKSSFTSKFLGVTAIWASSHKEGGSRITYRARYDGVCLGTFDTEEEAARAYAKVRDESEKLEGENGSKSQEGPAKAPDGLQETVEVLQRQLNELKPQQLEKLLESFKAEITWRPDDVEDFNFDLKILPVTKLRELARLIAKVRAEGSQFQGIALDERRFQPTGIPGASVHHEQALQDRVRELEQQNEHQQRQLEEQKVQMLHMAAQAVGQDPRFAPPGLGRTSSMRWEEPAVQAVPSRNSEVFEPWKGWIGDGGGWVPGGEPPKNAQPPAVPPGDTAPPGRCMETCRCGQVVSRAWEVEKAWLKDEARAMAIMAAIQRFESHPSVERRGKVSKQNRYEPANQQAFRCV